MSEEEKQFKRSEVGHDANALHNHGGQDAHGEKSAREDLEDVIEALEEDDELEEVEQVEVKITKSEPEEKEEPKEEPKDEPVEEEPAKVEKPAPTQEMIEDDFVKSDTSLKPMGPALAPKEPVDDWQQKADNQPYMTIDSVEDKGAKKSSGTGLKILATFFLLLAIAGCGAAAYVYFQDGSIEILGRKITTTDAKKETPVPACATPTEPTKPTEPDESEVSYEDGKLIISKWGVELDMKQAQFVDYKLESLPSSDEEVLKLWLVDPTNAATLPSKPAVADSTKNTQGMVALYRRNKLDSIDDGASMSLVYAIPDGGGYIYYDLVNKDFYGNYVTEDKELNLKVEEGAVNYIIDVILKTENFSPIE